MICHLLHLTYILTCYNFSLKKGSIIKYKHLISIPRYSFKLAKFILVISFIALLFNIFHEFNINSLNKENNTSPSNIYELKVKSNQNNFCVNYLELHAPYIMQQNIIVNSIEIYYHIVSFYDNNYSLEIFNNLLKPPLL